MSTRQIPYPVLIHNSVNDSHNNNQRRLGKSFDEFVNKHETNFRSSDFFQVVTVQYFDARADTILDLERQVARKLSVLARAFDTDEIEITSVLFEKAEIVTNGYDRAEDTVQTDGKALICATVRCQLVRGMRTHKAEMFQPLEFTALTKFVHIKDPIQVVVPSGILRGANPGEMDAEAVGDTRSGRSARGDDMGHDD